MPVMQVQTLMRPPVLFWFYGGALPHGSGSLYDGAWPAEVCDAVVVTVNYRLDPPATPMSPADLAVTATLHRAAPSCTPALPRAPQQARPAPLRATGPRHGDPGRPGPGSYTTPVANAASSPGPRPAPRADHPASLEPVSEPRPGARRLARTLAALPEGPSSSSPKLSASLEQGGPPSRTFRRLAIARTRRRALIRPGFRRRRSPARPDEDETESPAASTGHGIREERPQQRN